MRIVVLGTARSGTDPRTTRLVRALLSAGHDVTLATSGRVDTPALPEAVTLVVLDTRWPARGSRVSAVLRRLNPTGLRDRLVRRRRRALLEELRPDVVYTRSTEIADEIEDLGIPIATEGRTMGRHTRALAATAARDHALAGIEPFPQDRWLNAVPSVPEGGRHAGRRVVLCYHPTSTTPARHLHAALERSGVSVEHRYPHVDMGTIDSGVDAVVFVESPYPAPDVIGDAPCPVLYWVHHGEPHLYQNLRLTERVRADAVLLAHSWHLGHRFAVPTFAFPFGVAPELLPEDVAWEDRLIAVSMIGSGFDDDSSRYAARRAIADDLTARFGSDHVRFEGGLDQREVVHAYAQSRIVVDDGGERHHPITMRVFEATGTGAALATDPAPGIDSLFRAGSEYLQLDPQAPLAAELDDREIEGIASAGEARALRVHTYDHRVDELFEILERIERQENHSTELPAVVESVGTRAEIDSIACAGEMLEGFNNTSYVAWSHDQVRTRQITVDALVLGPAQDPSPTLVALAHRYVFCSRAASSTVRTMLVDANRTFSESTDGGLHIFDLLAPGYIVRTEP